MTRQEEVDDLGQTNGRRVVEGGEAVALGGVSVDPRRVEEESGDLAVLVLIRVNPLIIDMVGVVFR